MTALAEFSLTFHCGRATAYLRRLALRPREEPLLLAAREHIALAREELQLLPPNASARRTLEKLEKQVLKWEQKFQKDFPREPEDPAENSPRSSAQIRDAELALAAARNNLDAAELGLNEGVLRGECASTAFQGRVQALDLVQESLENQRTEAALARKQLRRLWGRVLVHRWEMVLATVVSLGLLGLTIWDFVKSVSSKE